MLNLKLDTKDNIRLVVAEGRINSETAQQFGDFVESSIDSDDVILVFQLCGVEYISSAGLRILLNAKMRLGCNQVFLTSGSATVMKVLKIAGLAGNVITLKNNYAKQHNKYMDELVLLLRADAQ